MATLELAEKSPTAAEYIDFRAKVGWGNIDEATATRSLKASTYSVTLRQDGNLVGFARVMGDGVLFFFLAEVIVDDAVRGQGCGEQLMGAITRYFERAALPDATITLVAMPGRERFYERFGF